MSRRVTLPPAQPFGPAVTRTPERSLALEWLIANGRGDFGSGTVAGPNTRRAHGLFAVDRGAAAAPMLLLAALDTTLERDGQRYDLSCHQYEHARHPLGYEFCSSFAHRPFPTWRFDLPGARLTFRVFLPRGRRAVAAIWTMLPGSENGPWRLLVRPLFAYREIDALTHANDRVNMTFGSQEGRLRFAPYAGCPEILLDPCGAEAQAEPCWYYRFYHAWDTATGRDAVEDLFAPVMLRYRVRPGESAALIAGLEPVGDPPDALEAAERRRVESVNVPTLEEDAVAGELARAAEVLTVDAPNDAARLITTYLPPQSDLRSELIALPGLLLCTRRLAVARTIVTARLQRVLDAPPEAPLDDTPLWLLRAAGLYVDHSRDWDFLRDTLTPAAEGILQRYLAADSGPGFRAASDGLLAASDPALALTWMDARLNDWPVTPRRGKPVEVNALWHYALGLAIRWMRRKGDTSAEERYGRLLELCARSFRLRFWNPQTHGLYDTVDVDDAGAADPAIRPNQILAVALPADLLDRRQAEGVLRLVENRLLTPFGLRTLSLEDRAFQPQYGGDASARAAARHQGAVHSWLLGPYVDAVFRVYGRTAGAYARAEQCLDAVLRDHSSQMCPGQVSEIFQAVAPHTPHGAIAHAPAVGEILRVLAEIRGRMV